MKLEELRKSIKIERDLFQEQLNEDERINGKIIDRIKAKHWHISIKKCDFCWDCVGNDYQIITDRNIKTLEYICHKCMMFCVMQHHKLKYFKEHRYIREKTDLHEKKYITIYKIEG